MAVGDKTPIAAGRVRKMESHHQPNVDVSHLSVDDRIRTVYPCFLVHRPMELLLTELTEEPFLPLSEAGFETCWL